MVEYYERKSPEELKARYNQFLATFNTTDPYYLKRAQGVVDFILGILNDESLRGYISDLEYMTMFVEACSSLFTVIYIENGDVFSDPNRNVDVEIIVADNMYVKSYEFMECLFSRLRHGMDYELLKLELESKKPVASSTLMR